MQSRIAVGSPLSAISTALRVRASDSPSWRQHRLNTVDDHIRNFFVVSTAITANQLGPLHLANRKVGHNGPLSQRFSNHLLAYPAHARRSLARAAPSRSAPPIAAKQRVPAPRGRAARHFGCQEVGYDQISLPLCAKSWPTAQDSG